MRAQAQNEPPPINESGMRVINLMEWTWFKGERNGQEAVHGGADYWAFAAGEGSALLNIRMLRPRSKPDELKKPISADFPKFGV